MFQTVSKYRLHIALLLLFAITMLLVRARLIFSYSLDLDGLEYYFLHLAQQVTDGKHLYANPEIYPYSNCLYTPVFFYVYSSILSLLKLNTLTGLHGMLIAGRFLSFVCVLFIIYYLKKIANKFGNSFLESLLLITIFLLLITGHIYVVRPDGLKILFFILFFYFLLEFLFYSKKITDGIICIATAILAVYTKQDISIHISICFLVAIYTDRSKKAIYAFILFFVSCLLLFGLFWKIYGEHIFTNIILFNLQTITAIWKSYNILFLLLSLLRTMPLLWLTIHNYKVIKKHTVLFNAEKFIIFSTFLLYIIAHLSFFRPGANFNYTYELIIFLVVNIAIYYKLQKEKNAIQNQKQTRLIYAYIFFLALTNFIPQTYFVYGKKEALLKVEYLAYLSERKTINEIIKADTIFFPNTKYAVYFDDKHVVLGHDMHLDRFINLYTPFNIQSKLSVIDTKNYDNNFKTGRIRYIIVTNDEKSAAHVRKYYPDYSLLEETVHFKIYEFIKSN